MPEDPRPLPDFVAWPTFPFEGDLRVRRLEDPAPVEPPREGDDPSDCRACSAPDEAYIWVNDQWRVRSLDRPTGLPMVLILESRSHLDLGDLPNMLAAELGIMTVRLERAIRSLEGVARVHVNRWGDGSAHLHLWFLARPYGHLQLRGSFLSLWDEILPPIPEHQWRENLALVAAWLGDFGGRPLAEPPHLDWKSPATLASIPPSFTAEDGADGVVGGGAAGAGVSAPVRVGDSVGDRTGSLTADHVTPVAGSATGEPIGPGASREVMAGVGDGPMGDPTGDSSASGFPRAAGMTDQDGATRVGVVNKVTSLSAEVDEPTRLSAEVDQPGPPSSDDGRALPDEFATVREVRVTPGPGGFAPITGSAVQSGFSTPGGIPGQGGSRADDPAWPVPGQREGSEQERDWPTATPGVNR